MNQMYDLAVHDVLYERSIQQAVAITFTNGSQVTSPPREYSTEYMVDEIQILIDLTKDDSNRFFIAIRDSMKKQVGRYSLDYKAEYSQIDYAAGTIDYQRPKLAELHIESSGIPYGLLNKYQDCILSINIIFGTLRDAYPSIRNHHYRLLNNPYYMSYTPPLNIYPFPDREFFFDKEMKIPFSTVFNPKTNKEAKKQARLESFDD
jgi:hypothetical protein